MTGREQIIAGDRFRRALLVLQTAGWAGPEQRVKVDIHAAAVAAIEAYEAFTAAGLGVLTIALVVFYQWSR
jgi:hypothetical protein